MLGPMGGMKSSEPAIRVECYSGYRGEETPRRFAVWGRWVEVVEVVDAWLGPAHRYFKVSGEDGFTYLLRHDVEQDRWQLAGSSSQDGAIH